MKVAHLASFRGNIGDIINHAGFYSGVLYPAFPRAQITQIEIRDFYRNAGRRVFDARFADEINTHDLLVIGGGGFFDVRWDDSSTGTTLDFSRAFLDRIKTPILINAMGYHEFHEGSSELAYRRFEAFLSDLGIRENVFTTVRNDGSLARMSARYGADIARSVKTVPDNAFYYTSPAMGPPVLPAGTSVIGVCITNDLFSSAFNNGYPVNDFNRSICGFITGLLEKGFRIILFPHTPQDISTVEMIHRSIGDRWFRTEVFVAPYAASDVMSIAILENYYRASSAVISMRFHSSILSIISAIPVIGLAGHAQIEALFSELSLGDLCVRVDSDDYVNKLGRLVASVMRTDNSIRERLKKTRELLVADGKAYSNDLYSFYSKLR